MDGDTVTLQQDFTFAARLLRKDWRFTAAAVFALGLAIGVNNSVFVLVNTALIRDLPFPDADRLVAINVAGPGGASGVSYEEFRDLRESTRAFEGVASAANAAMILSEEAVAPERFRGSYVSANTFALLRTRPILGRDFLAEDDRPGAPPVVMLGHAVWQNRYGGDRSVVGRTIKVNEVPTTVIGVMPPGFAYPFVDQVWQPLSAAPRLAEAPRDTRNLRAVARLADGADLANGRAEVQAIAARLAQQFPATNRSAIFAVTPLRAEYGQGGTSMLMVFVGAVALVLLVACANLANLLLARSASRSREIAIRASLGASRWRVVRQLLVECLLIAVMAGGVGTVLSIYGARTIAVGFDIFEAAAPSAPSRPFWVDLSMDGLTVAFIGLLCVFATLACGLVPALHLARTDINGVLKETAGSSGGGARRWAGAFVVAEVACTLMLLSAAGVLWRGFLEAYYRDTVIETSDLVSMRFALPAQKYASGEDRRRFLDALEQRLASLAVVESASIASVPPFDFTAPARLASVDGREAAPGETLPGVSYVLAGARYFETVRLPIVSGRALAASDSRPGQEGAVVDERFVATLLAGGDALGRRVRLTAPGQDAGATEPRWFTVVGVTRTLPPTGPPQFVRPMLYAPLAADPSPGAAASVLVRDRTGLTAITSALRQEVRMLDPDLPLYGIETLDASVARSRNGGRLLGTWSGVIAVIALLMASVGLYALTAHAVTQRTREIGVRVALGARPAQVVSLFLRRSLAQLGLGIAFGLAGALAAGRLLQGFVSGIAIGDLLTLLAVVVLLTVVALTACAIPARRATRVDPVTALRAE